MTDERIKCPSCGQWMFHLAKKCPHCGKAVVPGAAVAAVGAPGKLELSGDEARAFLAAQVRPANERFSAVAADMVMPGSGVAELVLSMLAAPLTLSTVVTLGYFLLREKRSRRDEKLNGTRMLAVPVCTVLFAVTLAEFNAGRWWYVALAVSFVAWVARALIRRGEKRDPLS